MLLKHSFAKASESVSGVSLTPKPKAHRLSTLFSGKKQSAVSLTSLPQKVSQKNAFSFSKCKLPTSKHQRFHSTDFLETCGSRLANQFSKLTSKRPKMHQTSTSSPSDSPSCLYLSENSNKLKPNQPDLPRIRGASQAKSQVDPEGPSKETPGDKKPSRRPKAFVPGSRANLRLEIPDFSLISDQKYSNLNNPLRINRPIPLNPADIDEAPIDGISAIYEPCIIGD